MATFESTGTVSLTNGSTKVTGAGTGWAVNYPGVLLIIEGAAYPVASIDGGSSLTLVKPYRGTSVSGVEYTFAPLQPDNYRLAEKVNDIIDIAGQLVDASRGPAGPKGDSGTVGPPGKNGETAVGAVVGLTQYAGQPAGGSGVNLIVPIALGDPGITLTQSSTVVLPYGKDNAGIGLWIKAGVSGYAITLGLTNAPLPQPELPSEPADLSGSSTLYGQPGTVIPLGIFVGGSNADFTVNIPTSIPVKIERRTDIVVQTASTWRLGGSGAPYPVTGNAVSNTAVLNKAGDVFDFRNGNVVLPKGSSLFSEALAFDFKFTNDDVTTQCPPTFRIGLKGVIPEGTGETYMVSVGEYATGGMTLGTHWTADAMFVNLNRPGGGETIISPPIASRRLGTNQFYEAEWIDNMGGKGGTVQFYIDGVAVTDKIVTEHKPRIAPAAAVEINASSGNTSNAVDGLEVESFTIKAGKPDVATSYDNAVSGRIERADLEALVIDARSILTNQAPAHVVYTANGIQSYDIEVIVGEMVLPAGRAHTAILEDWSTGVGVPHPNRLVMTKPTAQNCKFEDVSLYSTQPTWTEVISQGPVPSINGINYYCEGIRMGNYVQFQFGYDWNTDEMPSNPFGDPTGHESYMVPHKWIIQDINGTVLARVEKPNGEPLNAPSTGPVWEGETDGRGIAKITANNPYYPHGTVRAGVIWRSHEPVAYSQAEVWNSVPVYDMRVPFACATGYSVNGGDMRIFSGGQANGFGNYRVMSWEPTNYQDIQDQAYATKNPWKNSIYTPTGAVPNAGVWLKYTPFNMMARSPITGPGGARDDRQIMPEPVAIYARDVNSKRPHDERSMKSIALDYLTGYVSDPYHAFEKGRNKPLFKGNPRRGITMRNHYYGPGERTTPANQAYYIQGGRPYDFSRSDTPLRVNVPGAGSAPNKPIFGTNQIDDSHAHQLPHWGSLMFKTPEFAFLGHKFYDQAKLYNNIVLGAQYNAAEFYERGAAWKFMHTALAWKTASNNSDRLYNRAEIMDFITVDFEYFYDTWYNATPGFLNPPTNIMVNGEIDGGLATWAGAARFGVCTYNEDAGVHVHDFIAGYWLSALHAAEKIGFNAALRAASPKVKAVIDWLFAMHRKRGINRINGGTISAHNGSDYLTAYWTVAEIKAANGDVSKLHQTVEDVVAARPAPAWDITDSGGGLRDGQAMDQLLAAPSLLKDMGMSGSDVERAITTAEQRFQQKLVEETAKGSGAAGETWFKYHQSTNNRVWKPPV